MSAYTITSFSKRNNALEGSDVSIFLGTSSDVNLSENRHMTQVIKRTNGQTNIELDSNNKNKDKDVTINEGL